MLTHHHTFTLSFLRPACAVAFPLSIAYTLKISTVLSAMGGCQQMIWLKLESLSYTLFPRELEKR
jgi:hypothetical protein